MDINQLLIDGGLFDWHPGEIEWVTLHSLLSEKLFQNGIRQQTETKLKSNWADLNHEMIPFAYTKVCLSLKTLLKHHKRLEPPIALIPVSFFYLAWDSETQ